MSIEARVVGLDETKVITEKQLTEFTKILRDRVDSNIRLDVTTVEPIEFQANPCTSRTSCNPVVGGASISVSGMGPCTFGYEATRLGVNGFVTAGHCADGKVGYNTYHPSGSTSFLGIVNTELFYNNSFCDCAFINTSASAVDNKVYLSPTIYAIPTS